MSYIVVYLATKQRLTQDILDYSIPLRVEDIVDDIEDNKGITEQISMQHINQAVVYMLGPQLVQALFRVEDNIIDLDEVDLVRRPKQPSISKTPLEDIQLAKVLSLLVSKHDEVSIKGTYAIYDNIFNKFLKAEESKFKDQIVLVQGD